MKLSLAGSPPPRIPWRPRPAIGHDAANTFPAPDFGQAGEPVRFIKAHPLKP